MFWLDTWVLLADAPHPNAAYAFLNFIHDPEIQAEETNYNGYGTPNDEAKQFVDPAVLADPAVFPPDDVDRATSKAPKDTSATRSAPTSGRSSSRSIGG